MSLDTSLDLVALGPLVKRSTFAIYMSMRILNGCYSYESSMEPQLRKAEDHSERVQSFVLYDLSRSPKPILLEF